jgi:hypothetical protein
MAVFIARSRSLQKFTSVNRIAEFRFKIRVYQVRILDIIIIIIIIIITAVTLNNAG